MIGNVASDGYSFSYPADFIPGIGPSTPVNWKSVFLYPFQLHLSSVCSPKPPREIEKERESLTAMVILLDDANHLCLSSF